MMHMSIVYNICAFLFLCFVAIFTRVFYLIFIKSKNTEKKHIRTTPVKTMIILGSGGHTAEMIRIVKNLNFKNYSPRIYICAKTDKLSSDKIKLLENDNVDYKVIEIYRSREVLQSYITSIYTTIRSTLECFPLLCKDCPELILCNGPESFCRVKTFSLTGKILYYLADHVIVQWKYLSKPIMCQNIVLTAEVIPWELLLEDLENNVPIDIKVHLKPIAKTLKDSSENKTKHKKKWIQNSLLLTEACLDRTWEMLNSGYWKDVPIEYRHCYSLCTIIKAVLLELDYEECSEEQKDGKLTVLKNIIQQIDKGILLGAPLPSTPQILTNLASKINDRVKSIETVSSREIHIDDQNIAEIILPGFSEVNSYERPSMESFYRDIFMPKVPAVLKGCINHWKALTLWRNVNYLTKIAGSRTVPIEIGSRYTEEDWTQNLIKFSEFLNVYISEKNEKVGYLAQHQLFEQIPELKEDFAVPDYCNFSDNEEPDLPDINAWFGPAKTVSPLHYDPKNNLLCQVFGYKRVILYSPEDTANLYPYETRLLNNTAQVDPMNPDYSKWPNFQNAKGVMCYLKPGEMLYIPPKWWHHVTALSPSFSISFWWN